jgi:glucokinase
MRKSAGKGRPVLAIDLGGTKILIALVSAENEVIARQLQPTRAESGQAAVIALIKAGIDRILTVGGLETSQLEAIAVAAAGAISSRDGVVTNSPHLPDWLNVPLRRILVQRYTVDTFIINDASAAALGEYHLGVGRGVANLIYLTIGTGIGGGIITNGRLYLGSDGSAGELGHMTIDVSGQKDSCGNLGCLEMLASGSAIATEAKRRLKEGQNSLLAGVAIDSITVEEVAAAAEDGDKLSQKVINQAAAYLGVGLVRIVNIFNPDMIVIGGGVAKMGDRLLQLVRQVVAERAFTLPAGTVRIEKTLLGDDAGVLGAALFARQQKEDL